MVIDRFNDFEEAFAENFANNFANQEYLFRVDVSKDDMWNTYLNSFPEGTNPIYKTNTEMDCNCCKNFIGNVGNVVKIDPDTFETKTIWDFDFDDAKYSPMMRAMNNLIKSAKIRDVFLLSNKVHLVNHNRSMDNNGHIDKWDHLWAEVPNKFIMSGDDIPARLNTYRTSKEVFLRSLNEISDDSISSVTELINSNNLYRGEEWKKVLKDFGNYKAKYNKAIENGYNTDNFVWFYSVKAGPVVSHIRNHSFGTLLVDISSGVGLDKAVKKYEDIVAPTNYKRPKPIVTKAMIDRAQQTVEELGYMDSLPRRFATLDDITVNNILFSNKDSGKRIEGFNVFDEMRDSNKKENVKSFSRAQEISADDFVKKVLPTAKEVEALVEYKHIPNFVSLIAPVNKDAKNMFKWNNGFSWAYTGNIADSNIRENVKKAGGNVHGVLRFSIQWNDADVWNMCDYDAHCVLPSGHIYYGDKICGGGALDVDITSPKMGIPAVENIVFTNKDRMRSGTYRFFVYPFAPRSGNVGFKAEIEMDGQTFRYEYNNKLDRDVNVASVSLNKDGKFTINHNLTPIDDAQTDVWGVKTNTFVPVSVVMYSPNYWDEQKGIGNKHYMFMLKGCKNPDCPNGFYNEFLDNKLNDHRKVFELLGSKMAVQPSDDQLSGLGFSSTKRNELVVRVKGATNRVMKIKF